MVLERQRWDLVPPYAYVSSTPPRIREFARKRAQGGDTGEGIAPLPTRWCGTWSEHTRMSVPGIA
eukprot:1033876-Rhodomonas_salina.3